MNILVIGNGFDLAHGLPTSYKEFLKFVLESEDTPLTQELVHQYVEDSKNQIVYVNEVNFAVDEDDE